MILIRKEKDVWNTNAIACKLRPIITKVSNHQLEVTREKKQKKEEMVEKQKIKTIIAKHCKYRESISLCIEEEENYESNTRDNMDLKQVNDKYLL